MRDLQLELCNGNLTANLATLLEVCVCVCGGGGEVGLGELNWEDKSRGNWIIKNVQLKPSAILIVELSKQQKQNRNKLNSTHSMVNQVARSELRAAALPGQVATPPSSALEF